MVELTRKVSAEKDPAEKAFPPVAQARDHEVAQVPPVWTALLRPKVMIGAEGDSLEREADQIADAVSCPVDRNSVNDEVISAPEEGTGIPVPVQGAVPDASVQRSALPGVGTAVNQANKGEDNFAVGRPLSSAERSFMQSRIAADFGEVRIHNDDRADIAAKAVGARAFTSGSDVVFRAGEYREGTTEGRWLLAHELTHVVQQRRGNGNFGLVQRDNDRKGGGEKEPQFQFTVVPQQATDATGFRILVCMQILGVAQATAAELAIRLKWSGPNATKGVTHDAVGKPVKVVVAATVYRELHGPSGPGGAAGTAARTADFNQLSNAERQLLKDEVDRRFRSRTGTKLGTSPQDNQMAELWLDIRDEVLAQRNALRELPLSVQQEFGRVTRFKPQDYPQLIRIAGKISPSEWMDYLSRVSARSESLDQLEDSVDAYLENKRKRDTSAARYTELQIKLAGTEYLYKAYKDYQEKRRQALGTTHVHDYGAIWIPPSQAEVDTEVAAEKSLTAALVANEFSGGIPEFEASIEDFLASFEAESVNVGLTTLDRYESFLFKQDEYYQNDAVIAELYDSLAPLRQAMGELATQKQVMEELNTAYRRQEEESLLPGSGHIRPDPAIREKAEKAHEQAQAHKARAISVVQGLSDIHPIFKEEHLPLERRIPKYDLAKADKADLKRILAQHIADRTADVRKTRANLRSDPELIYKMDQLMAESLRHLEITPGSIFAELVQEKTKRIQREENVIAATAGVLAIAFTILTFGTGTIAVVGALGTLALSGGVAYQEFERYRIASAAAGSGLSSDEPSPAWLVLAVVSVVADASAALMAAKVLTPAAKALEAGGELAVFRESVQLLEKQGKIEAEIARSAVRAGEAREAYVAARAELSAAWRGKAYSFPGPLADNDVFKAVVKVAEARSRQGLQSVQQFILELNKLRVEAKLSELSGKELALAKRAFREGRKTTDIVDPLPIVGYPIGKAPTPAMAGSRQAGITRAWKQEVELIRETGRGSRAWTKKEIARILNGEDYRDLGYTGHHINRVRDQDKWKGDPRNIAFLRQGSGEEHMVLGHPGGTQAKQPPRDLIDRQQMLANARKR